MKIPSLVLLLSISCGWVSANAAAGTRDLQSSNPRVIAEAFECDEQLQEFSQEAQQAFKPLGYEIRVCVRPNRPTRNRGIVMRSIDDFTFFRDFGEVTQVVVKDQIDQVGSLSLCVPGSPICSFKAKLIDDFFYTPTNNTIFGTGTVSMEVQADSATNQRELQQELTRDLQANTAAGGFAGEDGVSIELYVGPLDAPDQPATEPKVDGTWWQDAPTWLKVLVIGGAVLVILMGLCLCGMCVWSVQTYLQEQREKRKDKYGDKEDHKDYDEF